MLVHIGEIGDQRIQMAVPVPGAALAAIRLEPTGMDPHRRAGLAAIAIRAVSEDAAAAKTVLDQFRVDVGIDQVRRCGHLRARLPLFKIAAWIGRSGIELQGGKGEVF